MPAAWRSGRRGRRPRKLCLLSARLSQNGYGYRTLDACTPRSRVDPGPGQTGAAVVTPGTEVGFGHLRTGFSTEPEIADIWDGPFEESSRGTGSPQKPRPFACPSPPTGSTWDFFAPYGKVSAHWGVWNLELSTFAWSPLGWPKWSPTSASGSGTRPSLREPGKPLARHHEKLKPHLQTP